MRRVGASLTIEHLTGQAPGRFRGSRLSAVVARTAAVNAYVQPSAIDQYGDLGVGEDLESLAAKHDRRDATAAMRSHQDQVAALRLSRLDDRLIGMRILGMHDAACNARRLGGV